MNWNQIVAKMMRVRFLFIYAGRLEEMWPIRITVRGEEIEPRTGQ
jgi:hypothetical protein